jgi:hypothetical protein
MAVKVNGVRVVATIAVDCPGVLDGCASGACVAAVEALCVAALVDGRVVAWTVAAAVDTVGVTGIFVGMAEVGVTGITALVAACVA